MIEIVKLNVVEIGTVSNSHREFEKAMSLCATYVHLPPGTKALLVALQSCKHPAAVFAEAKEFKRLFLLFASVQ